MAKYRGKTRRTGSERNALLWTALIVAASAGITVGAVAGVVGLWHAITGMEAFQLRPVDMPIRSSWLRARAAREDFVRTDTSGVLGRRCSIFAPDLARRVADAYRQSPWVRRVRAVRKVFPNSLEVNLEFREPFAIASVRETLYCVSDDAMHLHPEVYQLTPDRISKLGPLLVLPKDEPVPENGRKWENVSMLGGIELARLCREYLPEMPGVSRIEVETAHEGAGMPTVEAWIVLKGGPRVRWGRVPVGRGSPVEVSKLDKMTALLAVLRQEGSRLGQLKVIDVRHKVPRVEFAN